LFDYVYEAMALVSLADDSPVEGSLTIGKPEFISFSETKNAKGMTGFFFGQLRIQPYVGRIEYLHWEK
jgi:hypothetical protein